MSDSLDAACGQFEQVIIGQMLRTAGFGGSRAAVSSRGGDAADDGAEDSFEDSAAGSDAFSALIVQSLANAIERAGGIGLRRSLVAALAKERR